MECDNFFIVGSSKRLAESTQVKSTNSPKEEKKRAHRAPLGSSLAPKPLRTPLAAVQLRPSISPKQLKARHFTHYSPSAAHYVFQIRKPSVGCGGRSWEHWREKKEKKKLVDLQGMQTWSDLGDAGAMMPS